MAGNLLVAIAEPMQTELLAGVSHELTFLWLSHKVPRDVQARLAQLGFTDVDVWAQLEDSKKEARAWIKGTAGLKMDGNPNAMSIISRVLNSWTSAAKRGEKRQEVEAEQRAGDLPRKLCTTWPSSSSPNQRSQRQ